MTDRDRDWTQIHAAITRRVTRAADSFAALRTAQPELARFKAPGELLAELQAPEVAQTDRDVLYRALLGAMRAGTGAHAELARDVLWISAWPLLGELYQHARPDRADGAQAAADVSMAFAEVIVGLALVLDRPVLESMARDTAQELQRLKREERRWTRRHKVDQAGVREAMRDLTAEPEEDLGALRTKLLKEVGDDGALHFDRFVIGYTVPELAKKASVHQTTIRRRLQRADRRINEISRRQTSIS